MKSVRFILTLLIVCLSLPAMAFSSNAERVDSFVKLLNSSDYKGQEQMLNRLQWSGLSDPALFDVIEKRLLEHYKVQGLDSSIRKVMAYHVRALGYSGNDKYRATIAEVRQNAVDSTVKKHAKKALTDLSRWSQWHSLMTLEPIPTAGQSIEVATYLQMLDTENVYVQRLAARAIFHERITDSQLLNKAVEIIRSQYMDGGIDGQAEDTIAWLCKAVGLNAPSQYRAFLSEVSEQSPSRKIAKYALKYLD